MITLTLDTNCIITLDDGSGQRDAIQALIRLHRQGSLRLHLGVVSASENMRDGRQPTYDSFMERINRLGLAALPRLLPESRVGMSYVGVSVVAGDDGLDKKVQAILHPAFMQDYESFILQRGVHPGDPIPRKWRNMWCDVDAIVAHIRHRHDIFVTEDHHFVAQDRRAALIHLGAGDILTPEGALQRVTQTTKSNRLSDERAVEDRGYAERRFR